MLIGHSALWRFMVLTFRKITSVLSSYLLACLLSVKMSRSTWLFVVIAVLTVSTVTRTALAWSKGTIATMHTSQ